MSKWEEFFREKIEKIFNEKKTVLDIGGGLRISRKKGNRFDPGRTWILPLVESVDYKIMDPVPDYQPDILGNIHHIPLADSSFDAVICLAVLEHVEDPMLACRELYRVLKPGGYCLLYVPFLYYYHAEKGYYKDFWRFSSDAIDLMMKDFKTVEKQNVRGALATWIKISPLGRWAFLRSAADHLDRFFHKDQSRQTSGYYVFAIK